MLKYEWRPGSAIGQDDIIIHVEDNNNVQRIIPEPIVQEIQPAGPNPLRIVQPQNQGLAPQGADEGNNNEERQQLGVDEEQGVHHEDQGAHHEPALAPVENQDSDNDSNSDLSYSDESNDSEDDEECKAGEREWRGQYFDTSNSKDFGRGKRARNPNPSYSFLQTKFENLKQGDKDENFYAGW